jgi:flagellar L-ring protein precursor FlgH
MKLFRVARILLIPFALVSTAVAQARPGSKAAAPPVADSFALQPPVRQSWTSDKMRFLVGDIVTIIVNEQTSASANLTDNNTETRKKGMGLLIEPPSQPGVPTANTKVNMAFNNDGDSRKSGTALRTNTFSSTITARVVGVSPGGMLQIKAHKMVNVDKNQQDVTLSGWIRPQDIDAGSNTIASDRIADASIDYGQKGALGKPRSGLLSKVLGAIWP